MKPVTFWVLSDKLKKENRLWKTIIGPYFGNQNKFEFKYFGEEPIDQSHVNVFMIGIKSASDLISISDYTDDIKKAYDQGLKIIIEYSWECISKNAPKKEWFLKNNDIIQKYNIKMMANDHHRGMPLLDNGENFLLPFNLFPYELRKTSAISNIGYHLNTHRCLEQDKKYFLSLFIGDIKKITNTLIAASFFRRGIDKHSVYSTVFGRYDLQHHSYFAQILVLQKELETSNKNKISYDMLSTFEYLNDYEDDILKHLPFERYEGQPDFDVNRWTGGNEVERKIPQVAHESHLYGVVETLSRNSQVFFTEKTYKPIYAELPFLILGSSNQNVLLKEKGYEIFEEIFDYSFERQIGSGKYIQLLSIIEGYFNEIERVMKEGSSIFYQRSVQEKIRYNKYHFEKSTTRDALEKELLELFN